MLGISLGSEERGKKFFFFKCVKYMDLMRKMRRGEFVELFLARYGDTEYIRPATEAR